MKGYSYTQVEYIKADGDPNVICKITNLNDCILTQYNPKLQLITNIYSKHSHINLKELISLKQNGMITFTDGQFYILIENIFLEINRLQFLGIPHQNLQSEYIWIIFEIDSKYEALSREKQLIKYEVRFTYFLLYQKQENRVCKDDRLQLIEICQELIKNTIEKHKQKEDYWNQFNTFKDLQLLQIINILQKIRVQFIDVKKQRLKKEFKLKKESSIVEKGIVKLKIIYQKQQLETFLQKQLEFINKTIKEQELLNILQHLYMHQLMSNFQFYLNDDSQIHQKIINQYTLLLEYSQLNQLENMIISSPIDDYFNKIIQQKNVYPYQNAQKLYQEIFIYHLQINGLLNSFEIFSKLDKTQYQKIKTEIKQQLYQQTLYIMQEIFRNSVIYLNQQLKFLLPNFPIHIIILNDTKGWFQNIIDQNIDEYYPLKQRIFVINQKLSQYFNIINQYIQDLESSFLKELSKQVKIIQPPLNLIENQELQDQIIQLVDDEFKILQISDLEQFMTIDLQTLLQLIKQKIFDSVKIHFYRQIEQLVEDIFENIVSQEK